MRVLVCGGRNFYDKQLLKSTLDRLHAEQPISCIIQGGASGADFLSKHWAVAYGGMRVEEYKADWKSNSRSAGPKRNALMLLLGKPDLVVAFPGGKGTADMTRRARRAGLTVIEILKPEGT